MGDNVAVAFVAVSILRVHEFSWVFLVDWIMIMVLSIFAIFYFNQLLGFVVTHTIGWYVWHRYDVYFKVESVQISLFAGRVMFSNVVYIGTSEAARIIHGSIGWRYWIRHRRRSALVGGTPRGDCAFELKANGVEWFVYNRELAYEVLGKNEPPLAKLSREFEKWQRNLSTIEHKVSELLPLHIDARNLSFVLGNDETETLLVMSAPSASGVVDMDVASNEFDRYSIRLNLSFELPEFELHSNPDYRVSSIVPMPTNQQQRSRRSVRKPGWIRNLKLKHRTKESTDEPWTGLKRYKEDPTRPDPMAKHDEAPQTPSSSEQDSPIDDKESPRSQKSAFKYNVFPKESAFSRTGRSQTASIRSGETRISSGESRLDDVPLKKPLSPSEVRTRLAALPSEYARVSQVLACDRLDIYAVSDVVGSVNADEPKNETSEPLFSLSLRLHGSKMNYGPWTERQRQKFWTLFFPRQCSDARVPDPPSAGELRMQKHTSVVIELLGESVVVVPLREKSKDEHFAANFIRNYGAFGDDIQRNYGWVELRAVEGSTISALIPLVASSDGFTTEFNIVLEKPEVRSSVTHDTMFYAQQHKIDISQHVPLVWNAMQTWNVDNRSTEMDFFVLREHITLLTDMINDFADGPPVPYAFFTPNQYAITWQISNFALFLNVNKGNIINNPTSRTENTFLILRTEELNVKWDLLDDEITRPTTNSKCEISAKSVDMDLSGANWHTLESFLDSSRMASVDDFDVQWSIYSSTMSAEHRVAENYANMNLSRYVDSQVIDINGRRLRMVAHGFLVDYVMRVRENYFGHAYHFQTTEEFLQNNEKTQRSDYEFSRNDLDTDSNVHVNVDQGVFLLPRYLYSAKESLALQFTHLALDARFTNYYMDLQVEFEPIVGRHLVHGPEHLLEAALEATADSVLSVSQIEVRAHRMFGLPPAEPTYVVKWDFDIGDVTVNADMQIISLHYDMAQAFAHGFADDENRPITPPEELNDATFLSANVSSVVATLSQADSPRSVSIALEVGPIEARFNDLANERYSGRATVEIPFLQLQCMADGEIALEVAIAIYVTRFLRKPYAEAFRAKQQAHIALHDALFHRAPFLLEPEVKNRAPFAREPQPDDLRPCIPLLPFAPPITRETIDILSPAGTKFSKGYRSGNDDSSRSESESGKNTNAAASVNGSYMSTESLGYHKNASQWHDEPTEPEVYPFAASEATDEREKLRKKRTDFELGTSTWRRNAPFLEEEEDGSEHSSMIVQVSTASVEVTPNIVAVIAELDYSPEVSFEEQLDTLQHSIVKALSRVDSTVESIKIHLVLPLLTLHLSERLRSAHGVSCEVKNIDVMWSSNGSQRGAHAGLSSLSVALRREEGRTIADLARIYAASIVLSKVVFWWSEIDRRKGTGGLSFTGVDMTFATDQIDWIILYSTELLIAIKKASTPGTRASHPQRRKNISAMFYALTMAGEQMGVEQDSYVLSRPSGAIQSRAHVRSQISWRIVMRLRYLLQRIPPEQLEKIQRDVARGRFQLPKDARQRMLAIYRRWRSWEQSDNLEDSEIFKQVLQEQSFQEYVLSMSTRLSLSIESMVVRLVYPDLKEHYVGLDSFATYLISTRMNETQNLVVTLRCSKLRALGSMELILVAAATIAAVAEARNQYSEAIAPVTVEFDGSSSDSDDDIFQGVLASEYPEPSPEDGFALQASVSMFLLDIVLEFDLETMKIETQNHQVQMTASLELMKTSAIDSLFHTGVLAASNSAFRIYRPTENVDILDSLITGIQVGYAGREASEQSSTWVTVNADSLSIVIHPTIPELAKLVVEFLRTELPLLKQAEEKLSEANALNESSKMPAVIAKIRSASITSLYSHLTEIFSGHFVNLSVTSIKLRFALVHDLRLVLLGKQLDFKLRHAETIVGSVEIERGTIGVHYGDGLASVAKLQTESAKSVIRVDPEYMAIAMINDLGALRMETMSLVWLLEYVRHKQLDSQIEDTLESVDQAMSILRELSFSRDSDSDYDSAVESLEPRSEGQGNQAFKTGDNSDPKLRLRLIYRIREISIILPLDTSSFRLTLADIVVRFEHFKTVDDLRQDRKLPLSIGLEVEDLAWILTLPQKQSREMLRLQFSGDINQEDERDTFNIQSEYIRFALDPEAIGAIFVAVEKLNQHTRALFKNSRLHTGSQPASPTVPVPFSPIIPSDPSNKSRKGFGIASLERLRINLLLKSVTVTWFTDSSSQDGIVLGYERLHIRVAKLVARLELVGTYITPVISQERQTQAVSERANTAYLPLVDAKVFITETLGEVSSVHLSMTGKSVSLMLTAAVAPWILKLSDSWGQAKRTVNRLASRRSRARLAASLNDQPVSPISSRHTSTFHIPFSLRMEMHFERGVLRILEESMRTAEPALELFSPSVDMTAENLKNRLLLRIHISPTSNKMYPKAISELKAISSQLSNSLGRHQSSPAGEDGRFESRPPLSNIAYPTQPQNPISDLELDIRIHLGSQKLKLSCSPFGKVSALLSTDQVDFIMAQPRSDERDDPYMVAHMLVKGAKVSIQHIYSREISAMAEFSQLSVVGMYRAEEPLKLALNLKEPQLMVKLGKLHDMRTFIEIWRFYENPEDMGTPTPEPEPVQTKLRRKYSTASAVERPSAEALLKGRVRSHKASKDRLIDRYRSAMSSVSFPWTVNVSILNLGAVIGMGPSIGDASITVDRIWAAILKTSTAEQAIHGGIDTITAQLDGRLGGTLRMDALMAKASIHWEDGRNYPLVHSKLRMGRLGFYFSLDFHPFIAGEVIALAVAATTQDKELVEDDRIYLVASCDSVSLVFTALVVSHTYDVVTLFKRLQSQISSVPIFMASDRPKKSRSRHNRRRGSIYSRETVFSESDEGAFDDDDDNEEEDEENDDDDDDDRRDDGYEDDDSDCDDDESSSFGMRTLFDIKLGSLMVHAFPTEFTDTVALKVFADRISVQFDRKEQKQAFITSVDFALTECVVGLANLRGGGYPKAMMDLNYEEYLAFVRRSASGGTIVNTPEISMLMDSVEPKGKNEVHYTFSNQLLGSIEVGWNLGSINFIKEMLETHKQAWAIRPTINSSSSRYYEDSESVSGDTWPHSSSNRERRSESMSTNTTVSSSETHLPRPFEPIDQHADESDNDLDSARDESSSVVFFGTRYIATRPPVILIPQLRDLGDATPPIEWLGVNRERLPLFLHHFVTRKLELGSDELEKIYRDIIGHAD